MNILILGGDGYLGWPTALHFSSAGHRVAVVDNMVKRAWEQEVGSHPLGSGLDLAGRVEAWRRKSGRTLETHTLDIAADPDGFMELFRSFRPDAIIHYAEQPSAPYSMLDLGKAVATQQNNVVGTLNVMFAMRDICPDAHLVKLGTMGEYGTPNIDIEEGWLEVEHKGRSDRMLYPKKPGSLYHLSKVHDSHNLEFGCRVWGLRVTDLNQGVVYGIDTPEIGDDADLGTRFHYDSIFGTVINRFVVQAVLGVPLTVYGAGGQTRGYLNLLDTLACVELATLNPADAGDFRVFNQFTEQFSVIDLAQRVADRARSAGYSAIIDHIENPRVEQESHYYNAAHSHLMDLGLEPRLLTDAVIDSMLAHVAREKDRIDPSGLMPNHSWKTGQSERTGVGSLAVRAA